MPSQWLQRLPSPYAGGVLQVEHEGEAVDPDAPASAEDGASGEAGPSEASEAGPTVAADTWDEGDQAEYRPRGRSLPRPATPTPELETRSLNP